MIVDSVRGSGSLQKLLLAKDSDGHFKVMRQAANRRPTQLIGHMAEQAAMAAWRKLLIMHYASITNTKEAEELATHRVANISSSLH